MEIKKIWAVSFSPTGNSKRVVNAIVSGLPGIPVENVDLTYPAAVSSRQFSAEDLVVLGAPVYAGRVASLAVQRLAGMIGHNTPAVLVVTYGNREFEDALLELQDISLNAKFLPIAAGAFIGEHSFSGTETPIAAGRPDAQDLATAEAFGVKIAKKLAEIENPEISHCPKVPGNRPYQQGMGQLPFTPMLHQSRCTKCALCVSVCPTGAISLGSTLTMDSKLCIFCCSCIKTCQEDALEIDAAPLKDKRQWLYEQCKEPKEAEVYL